MNGKACRISAEELRLVRSNISMILRPERIIYYIPQCGAGVPTMEHVNNEGPAWTFGRDQLVSIIESADDWLCVGIFSDYFYLAVFFITVLLFCFKKKKTGSKDRYTEFWRVLFGNIRILFSKSKKCNSNTRINLWFYYVSFFFIYLYVFCSKPIIFRKLITI